MTNYIISYFHNEYNPADLYHMRVPANNESEARIRLVKHFQKKYETIEIVNVREE